MRQRILVVEDDAALASVLCDNLSYEGFEVRTVADGRVVMGVTRDFSPDLVLLDVMLPGQNGFELCRTIREDTSTPVIMLTARVQKGDKLRGLKLGADDYVTKPFDMEELLARIHAVLRRAKPSLERQSRPTIERLALGHVTVDFAALVASNGTADIAMSHREFALLRYLAERANRIVYRDELLREVWGYLESPPTRSVDHAISRLRKKIEADPHRPRFIHTVQGDGYLLSPSGELTQALPR